MGEFQNWINDIGNFISSGGTSTNDSQQRRLLRRNRASFLAPTHRRSADSLRLRSLTAPTDLGEQLSRLANAEI